MKKVISVILALLLLTALSGCGGNLSKPKNGTYKSEGLVSQTWSFSGSNEVTLSTIGGLVSTQGTYSIDGDTITIDSSLLGVANTMKCKITEITSTSFFIDGTKYIKQ
ncbi:MAG: hypothetical protein FWH04_02730 [Oscillospiraceae bacterium]|nr:hypothetical protein [Oscillospiraceae bacterium]